MVTLGRCRDSLGCFDQIPSFGLFGLKRISVELTQLCAYRCFMIDESVHIPREREVADCPCQSGSSYATCCMPYHYGRARPETAEQLMRSRYTAYFFRRVEYLVETTHPDTRSPRLKQELEDMVHQVNWIYLKILEVVKGGKTDKTGKVEFVAGYFAQNERQELHERSRFKRHKGAWKYLDGKS